MMKKKNMLEYGILVLFMFTYLVNSFFQNKIVGNLTSPCIGLICTHLLYRTYRKATQYKEVWLTMVIAFGFWGVSDMLWAYYDLVLGMDPAKMDLFTYSYFGMNLCILIAIALYFIQRFRKWNYMQLALDVGMILITGSVLVWIFFFKENTTLHFSLNPTDVILLLSIITDFIAISSILIMYASVRSRKIPLTLKIASMSLIMYSLTDLYYGYLEHMGKYIPNSLIDGFYMLSIFTMAGAAVLEYHHPNIFQQQSVGNELPENVGRHNGVKLIVLVPIMLALFTRNNEKEIVVLLLNIAMNHFLGSYVQIAVKNEHLLAKEIQYTDMLEDRILERTEQLELANKRLENLTNLDILTKLYNRRYFMDEVDKFIQSQQQRKLTIFYMDLDMFKIINDAYGHDTGDNVIMEISRRLEKFPLQDAVLARLGGDEFVLAIKGDYSDQEIADTADQLVKLVEQPIILMPYQFNVSVSIGIAAYPIDATERNMLMKYADIAMYQAKSQDHNSVAFYRSYLSDKLERRHELEMLLKKAEYDQEFELYYQPQLSVPENRLVGAEALLRWKSPEKSFVSPAEFIPIAEESGCIVPIGEWVLRQSIMQISSWNKKYNSTIRMGINISPKQIDSVGFLTNFEKLLVETNVSPSLVDLEITERIAMRGESGIEEILNALTNLGVLVSIDDFGTGYSSLSYIKMFDIDRIKIAKELVDTITENDGSLQVVNAIIMMAKAMGLATIAEGVEHSDQLSTLIQLGCDEIQGYIFSKPVPAGEFEEKFMKTL